MSVPNNQARPQRRDSLEGYHVIKRIEFLGRTVPILCQNQNGPCPLLAICNVLLLRGHIQVPAGFDRITIEDVIQLIANRIIESNTGDQSNVDLRKNIDDVMSLLPRLQNGLDVNVRYRHSKDYEFTQEIAIFDILGINLVHGWLYDPANTAAKNALGAKSYNELVEKIINFDSAKSDYLKKKQEGSKSDEGSKGDGADEEGGAGAKVGEEGSKCGPEAEGKIGEGAERGADRSGKEEEACTGTVGLREKVADVDQALPCAKTEDGETAQETEKEDLDPELMQALLLSREASMLETWKEEKITVEINGGEVRLAQLAEDANTIQEFFKTTASQLTVHGLVKLHEEVRPRELCVFFRNNHFSTLFKKGHQVYLLLTDLGYQQQQGLVWELLNDIDGNTTLVDSRFVESSGLASTSNIYNAAVEFGSSFGQKAASPSRQSSEENDMRLAMQLQAQEDELQRQQRSAHGARQPPEAGGNVLAQQQAEYERLKKQHMAQQAANNKRAGKKKPSCVIS
eukprot:g205.t1